MDLAMLIFSVFFRQKKSQLRNYSKGRTWSLFTSAHEGKNEVGLTTPYATRTMIALQRKPLSRNNPVAAAYMEDDS